MGKLCKCGCGQELIIKKHHKYEGIPDYILGHNQKEHFSKKTIRFFEKIKNNKFYCKCGCGQEIIIKPRYKYDGIPNYIYKHHLKNSDKHNQKISGTRKRLFKEGKIIHPMLNKHLSEEIKLKIRDGNTNKIRSEETKKRISVASKKLWQNPEYRKKVTNEEIIKKRLQGLLKRPSSYEKKIIELCSKYNLSFIYKGNGGFLINFKNPDFINEQKRIVIEVFYSYFKIRDYGSVENYKDYCRQKYEPAGWKVLFLDENDVKAKDWEEICLNKIRDYEKYALFELGERSAVLSLNPTEYASISGKTKSNYHKIKNKVAEEVDYEKYTSIGQ